MRRLLMSIAVVVSVAVAGCGGAQVSGDPPGSYGGYSKGEAMSSAAYVLRSQLAEPDSPLFQKELEVGDLEQGQMSDGSRAWIAHLEDFQRQPSAWCLLVRAEQTASPDKAVVYDLQRCDALS